MSEIAQLLAEQNGVVARRQALAAELTPLDIQRLIRRREWSAVHRGGMSTTPAR